jgi:hypothetical protein
MRTYLPKKREPTDKKIICIVNSNWYLRHYTKFGTMTGKLQKYINASRSVNVFVYNGGAEVLQRSAASAFLINSDWGKSKAYINVRNNIFSAKFDREKCIFHMARFQL